MVEVISSELTDLRLTKMMFSEMNKEAKDVDEDSNLTKEERDKKHKRQLLETLKLEYHNKMRVGIIF